MGVRVCQSLHHIKYPIFYFCSYSYDKVNLLPFFKGRMISIQKKYMARAEMNFFACDTEIFS